MPARKSPKETDEKTIAFAYGFGPYYSKKDFKNIIREYIKDIRHISFAADPDKPKIKLICKSPGSCLRICRKLHGTKHTINNQHFILSVVSSLKINKFASQKTADQARIIVRNVPFFLKENDIQKRFSEYGPVFKINSPMFPDETGVAKQKGCTFIQYYHPVDAKRALLSENGKLFHGRLIAVDWAISKSKYQEIIKNQPKEEQNIPESLPEPEIIESKVETTVNYPKPPKPNSLDADRTLFITGLGVTASKDDITDFFSTKYGEINQTIIVKDKTIGLPNGSAFLIFKDPESVSNILAESDNKGLQYNGSLIRIYRAVTRERLESIKKRKELLKKKAKLDPAELRRRNKHQKRKLNSGYQPPISRNRICIRNLVQGVDEAAVKECVKNLTNMNPSKFSIKIVRDKFRKEPIALRQVGKSRNRSLNYGFIKCPNTKTAEMLLKSLDGSSLSKLFNNDEFKGNCIAEYSIENKSKVSF